MTDILSMMIFQLLSYKIVRWIINQVERCSVPMFLCVVHNFLFCWLSFGSATTLGYVFLKIHFPCPKGFLFLHIKISRLFKCLKKSLSKHWKQSRKSEFLRIDFVGTWGLYYSRVTYSNLTAIDEMLH